MKYFADTRTLQVGANDQDTLSVDLGPPGFSVKELGLLDLNLQGLPNSITPVSTLTGSSSRIPLDDLVNTQVTYVPPDNSPNLVKPSLPSSRDVIQLNGAGGRLTEVSINAAHDTSTKISDVTINVNSAVRTSTVQESISSWAYLDDAGNALSLSQPGVVQSGGKYWIQHQHNGGTYYYEAELTIHGDQHKITAQAKSAARIARADMTNPVSQPIRYAPSVSLAIADYSLTLDSVDETANGNLELVHLGGYYYVEEHLGGGQYAYYQADVTITTGGVQNAVVVQADRSQAISVSDQPYVSGSTTAHLDPADPGIKVNYIELSGTTHTDVMRADENGDYIFHIDEFTGGESAYKTAEIVRNQDGRYMLRTLNGAAEVALYYPLYYQNSNGAYLSSYSVVIAGIKVLKLTEYFVPS